MGQKTNPIGFRLAVRRNWQSRWYASKKDFGKLLHEDQIIRAKLMEKLKQASVPRIFIERASNRVRVKIYTARPGIVIGRKGAEVEFRTAALQVVESNHFVSRVRALEQTTERRTDKSGGSRSTLAMQTAAHMSHGRRPNGCRRIAR